MIFLTKTNSAEYETPDLGGRRKMCYAWDVLYAAIPLPQIESKGASEIMRKPRVPGQIEIPGVLKTKENEPEAGVPPPVEERPACAEKLAVPAKAEPGKEEVAFAVSDAEECHTPGAEIRAPAVAQTKQSRAKPIRRELDSEQNPGLTMELLLYRDSASCHSIRARLRWKGQRDPYVERYCETEEEARDWVRAKGEKELEKKHTPGSLKKLSGGVRFRSVLRVLDKAHGDEAVARFFEEHAGVEG